MAAMEMGDAKGAASYLLKAADVPVTDALPGPILNARLELRDARFRAAVPCAAGSWE